MQLSIASFFTAVKSKPKDEILKEDKKTDSLSSPGSSKDETNDSPIKRERKLKRRIEDSSDEEEHCNGNKQTDSNGLSKDEDKSSSEPKMKSNGTPKTPKTPPRRKTAKRTKKKPKIEEKTSSSEETNMDVQETDKATEESKPDIKQQLPNQQRQSDQSEANQPNHDTSDSKDDAEQKSEPKETAKFGFFAPRKGKSPSDKKQIKESTSLNSASSTNENKINPKSSNDALGKNEGGNIMDPVNYLPNKLSYDPIKDACWKTGQPVPYQALSKTFQIIEETSGRLKIMAALCNFFRSVIILTPDDLLPCVYLCLNKVAPAYEGIELGIGETILMKAVASSTGKSLQQLKCMAAEKGDLGIVAEQCRTNQRMMFAPPKLSIQSVFKKLKEIAKMTGSASMGKKQDKIQSMFVACKHSEARYLIRSLSGKLRIGLAEQSVLTALGNALALVDTKSEKQTNEVTKERKDAAALAIKTAYCELPNYDILIPTLLKEGWEDISKFCHITPDQRR